MAEDPQPEPVIPHPVGLSADDPQGNHEVPAPAADHMTSEMESSDGWLKRVRSLVDSVTAFMSLAARDWFSFLVNQPTNSAFQYNAKFENELERAVRLVVMVIVLTAIVLGGGVLLNRMVAFSIIGWATRVLIGAFLIAMTYGIFAFIFGVRVREAKLRKRLTVAQMIFPVLYVFVPWIPIYAVLWSAGTSGGTLRLLILVLLFWLCSGYVLLNFTSAIKRVTNCTWYTVWASVVVPVGVIVYYLVFLS